VADYAIVFARSARKELQKLDPQVARRIIKHVEALMKNARPIGFQTASAWLMSSPFVIAVMPTDSRESGLRLRTLLFDY
jgi:hypothetical protein